MTSDPGESGVEISLPAVVGLTIAGFDPSSGAGITGDLKVFAGFHIYGVAAITALTVQSTQGVRQSEPVDPELLAETLSCLAEDVKISGVKIGMLATAGAVEVVASFLAEARIPREKIVLDPVLRSSSGHELIEPQGIELLKAELLPLVGWVTPNIGELEILAGKAAGDSIPAAAKALAGGYPELNIVVTGGHLAKPNDFLRTASGEEHSFPGEWIETKATHGTGCAFSSALLCRLLTGDLGPEAVAAAKEYVRAAMKAAYPVGKGRGPMHHLYGL